MGVISAGFLAPEPTRFPSMADPPSIRVAVSGAAGRIAYALAFRIAGGGMFGPNQPVSLRLLDVPEAADPMRALELELRDCAQILLTDVASTSDPSRAFEGADWIFLLGGKPFSPERRSRLELLRLNAPIMIEHGRAINQVAPTARILVVTSPSIANCMVAKSQAPGVPQSHWFAMTQVARMRAMGMIAEKAGVPVSEVRRVTVWGNNSESAFIDLHPARIGDRPALEVIGDPRWVEDVLGPTIAGRNDEIFGLRGAMPAGSIAQAILGTVRSIVTPTPYERWFCAGVVSDGSYEVPRGLVFGFPLVTADGHTWSIVPNHYLDEIGRQRIAANVAEIQHETSVVNDLLGTI
jgi:malate dehydrogenase